MPALFLPVKSRPCSHFDPLPAQFAIPPPLAVSASSSRCCLASTSARVLNPHFSIPPTCTNSCSTSFQSSFNSRYRHDNNTNCLGLISFLPNATARFTAKASKRVLLRGAELKQVHGLQCQCLVGNCPNVDISTLCWKNLALMAAPHQPRCP